MAAYIQVQFTLDFFMKANNMNPDQTASKEQSDLGPICVQYRLLKDISRRRSNKKNAGLYKGAIPLR